MWLDAMVIVLVLLQVALLVLSWLQGRRLRRDLIGQANAGGGVPALLLTNTLNQIEHRLQALDERLRLLDEQSRAVRPAPIPAVAQPVSRPHQSATHNYELAQQLAREGCGLEVLMERCGLSRNEAELVQRLYAGRT
ncbi:DUF2802 domain-containing protein [Rhodanobacter sp. MP7CTX1]|uniref:DUF2802 domain-containing protein n=1 Tax=Rhodanobacter sp. MP7CTX1 TaxID=2723084 RepID=UPI0016121AC5|nr:hypothetical protein [Rhodanobacter sp. MP7CTX1]